MAQRGSAGPATSERELKAERCVNFDKADISIVLLLLSDISATPGRGQ